MHHFLFHPECQVTTPCGGEGWTRVVKLDLSDEQQSCPAPWQLDTAPDRSCTISGNSGCEGVTYQVNVPYSQVCGRITGYSIRTPDGFLRGGSIDGAYLDGVSVTHGSPRQHIWSFAAGHGLIANGYRCPCDNTDCNQARLPPTYVANNYYCDGDYNGAVWDGIGCTTICCNFNNPPFFTAALLTSTTDDIEVRICTDQGKGDEQINIRFMELYVQ